MRKYKCSICRQRLAVERSKKGWWFCEDCKDSYCNFCKAPLSEKEKRCLRRGHYKLCLDCMRSELEEEKERILQSIQKIERNYLFQITFQTCAKCGDLNDSRDEENTWRVYSKYCKKCREVYSAMRSLERTRPKILDERRLIWDKVTGFKTRT